MRMKNWIAFTALLLPLPALASTTGQEAPPRTTPQAAPASVPEEKGAIEGTWRMVSFRYGGEGVLQKVAGDRVMLKHITPGHFIWADSSAKTKKVSRMAGGTFTLKGSAYQETVEYGMGEDIQALLGKGQVFNDTITSQTWHHHGNLSTKFEIEENWERVQ